MQYRPTPKTLEQMHEEETPLEAMKADMLEMAKKIEALGAALSRKLTPECE